MSLVPLFSVILVDLIGFGVVMPILPFYAEAFGASATTLGLLLAVYALMQFCCAPLWGRLSDRIGRRKVLVLTTCGGALSLTILGLANSMVLIFLGRILSGIFAANISVAQAYVADVTPQEERTAKMGMIGAAFGIGFVIGPALGGILSPYGYALPILVAAALSFVNAIHIFLRVPEPARHEAQATANVVHVKILHQRTLRFFVLLNFLFVAGVSQLEAILAFFLMDRFGYGAHQVAYLLVYMALIMAAIQGGVLRRIKGVYDARLLWAGSLVLGLAFMAVTQTVHLIPLLVWLGLASIGRGFAQPALLGIFSRAVPQAQHGAAMGTFQSAASLARVFAPALAGLLYDRAPHLPFLLGGGVIVGIGIFLVLRLGPATNETQFALR
jgi:MFS transporter, DHA1 family, tetracycline resistance protein